MCSGTVKPWAAGRSSSRAAAMGDAAFMVGRLEEDKGGKGR